MKNRIPLKIIVSLLLSCLMFLTTSYAKAINTDKETIDRVLTNKNFNNKIKLINTIAENDPLLAKKLFLPLVSGEVFFNEDKELFRLEKINNTYQRSVFSTDLEFNTVDTIDSKEGYKKVRINNRIRRILKNKIAILDLKSDSVEQKTAALKRLLDNPNNEIADLVDGLYVEEKNSKVRGLMENYLSINNLRNNFDELSALDIENSINNLGESTEPAAFNTLTVLLEDSEDKKLSATLQSAINNFEGKAKFYGYMEKVFFGMSYGSVLVLAAIGLAITFGVMGVINMAHGELMMIGAYTTYVIQQLLPELMQVSILIAIPAAFIISGLVGVLMERLVIRHLYGRPLETLLATFGISLILQQAVRVIFSPLNRTVITPDWMSGSLEINSLLSLTWNRIYVIIFALLVFIAVVLVMKKTVLGLYVRAVSQNRKMAGAMGINATHVDMMTFGIGSGIAGVAGVALSLLTNVGPNLGQAYIIDSFMVVVFGGVGNLLGTLIAGMGLGILNKVFEPWFGAVLAKIIILVFIILFIQRRPKGLFPQRGRAVED